MLYLFFFSQYGCDKHPYCSLYLCILAVCFIINEREWGEQRCVSYSARKVHKGADHAPGRAVQTRRGKHLWEISPLEKTSITVTLMFHLMSSKTLWLHRRQKDKWLSQSAQSRRPISACAAVRSFGFSRWVWDDACRHVVEIFKSINLSIYLSPCLASEPVCA